MTQITDASIFIGSSFEGLSVGRAVKQQFGEVAGADLWNEGVFGLNKGNLETLIKAINAYDFAILCLTPDDMLRSRGKQHNTPRDNILFELGLFMGRSGIHRTFVICESKTKLPSDFDGVTVARFYEREDKNTLSGVSNACTLVRTEMEKSLKKSAPSFLPSTALALGYFQNFVRKVHPILETSNHVIIDGEPVPYTTFSLSIIIPKKIADIDINGRLRANLKLSQLREAVLETSTRRFAFYADMDTAQRAPNHIRLYDFPTTLVASAEVIELLHGKTYVEDDYETAALERREISNFAATLQAKCKDLEGVVLDHDFHKRLDTARRVQSDSLRGQTKS
jgi:hypothetical protein